MARSLKISFYERWNLSRCLVVTMMIVALVGLSACATRGGSVPYDVADFSEPDPISQTALLEEYTIAPLDELSIQVFQVADLSGKYEVDLTGRISMPLIGSVRAVDLTAEELSAELERRFAEGYLTNPEIGVGISESRGSLLTVEGSVRRPGAYPVIGRKTLLQVIAEAGGIDEFGNPRRVAIFRQIDGERMGAAFDVADIRAGEAQDPDVYRGDIIVVDGNRVRRAWRDALSAFPLFNVFSPI